MLEISKNRSDLPLVTVYMPTHNRVGLLQRAVESVLNQDYQNIELIVVDDNSTDTTPEYLAEISKKDPRVKFFRNDKNSGACVSRNKAIFSAQGEYITGLDDDDYFLPTHITSFLDAWMEKSPSAIALYANTYGATPKGIKPGYKKISKCEAKHLIHRNWVGNQIFTKTEYLVKSGGFDPKFPAWQDLDCWYNLLKTTGGTAESTGKYSYVMDVSHQYKRISEKNIDVIESAYNLFCSKHALSSDEKEIAKLMLTYYNKSAPNLFYALKGLMYFCNLQNFRYTLVLYYISLIKR